MKKISILICLLCLTLLSCYSSGAGDSSLDINQEQEQALGYEVQQLPEPQSRLPLLDEVNPGEPTIFNADRGDTFIEFPVESTEAQWTYMSGSRILGDSLLEENRLYFVNQASEIHCLDVETGERIFRFDGGAYYASTPVISGDLLYYHTGDGDLIVLDKMTGEEQQRISLEEDQRKDGWDYVLSTPVISQGKIYFGAGKGQFYCLDQESLEILWAIEGFNKLHTTPQFNNGTIYVADMSGNLAAIAEATGEVIWNVKLGTSIMGNPTIEGNRLFISSRNCRVHCLDASNGAELWNRSYGSGWIMATVIADDEALYVCGSDGYTIQALNQQDGSELWLNYAQYNVAGTPLLVEDKLLVTAGDAYNTRGKGAVMVFQAATGEPVFRFNSTSSFSSPILYGSTVFFGNDLGTMAAVDLSDYL